MGFHSTGKTYYPVLELTLLILGTPVNVHGTDLPIALLTLYLN